MIAMELPRRWQRVWFAPGIPQMAALQLLLVLGQVAESPSWSCKGHRSTQDHLAEPCAQEQLGIVMLLVQRARLDLVRDMPAIVVWLWLTQQTRRLR